MEPDRADDTAWGCRHDPEDFFYVGFVHAAVYNAVVGIQCSNAFRDVRTLPTGSQPSRNNDWAALSLVSATPSCLP